MRLHWVKIRNYRVHRDQEITFDPQCTLIGGANETGKSTLVEAVHRALFLKAKGNTEYHRAMTSDHGGHPEVELGFEVAGRNYTVKKRYGASGTTTLIRPSMASTTGDQAEAELAELLKVQLAGTGKALLSQWAHLWVWQGKACEDPSAHATAIKENLFRRLQSVGAAALLQSDLDARVAAHFAEARASIFTIQGKAKANSELDVAERAMSEARMARDAAVARIARLESASSGLDAARAELPQVDQSLVQLAKDQAALLERTNKHADLQRLQVEEIHAERGAAENHAALKTAHGRIATLETLIAKREGALSPLKSEVDVMTEALAAAREFTAESERRWRIAADAAREARSLRDLAIASRRLFELRKAREQLIHRQKRVNALRGQVAQLENQGGQLPVLDAARVRSLQKLESQFEKSQHALRAFAAAIEVVSADQAVTVAGQILPLGEKRILLAETEVQIGSGVHLRILPGGGTTLEEARRQAAAAEEKLKDALNELALPNVARATEVLAEREQIDVQIKTAQAQIETLDAADLEAQLAQLAEQISRSEGIVQRRSELSPNRQEPADESAAVREASAAEEAVLTSEDTERVSKLQWDAAGQKSQQAEESLVQKKSAFDRDQHAVEELKAELRVLTQSHGEEPSRADTLLAMEATLKTTRQQLEAVNRQMADLQPDDLPRDRARLERSFTGARDRRAQLQSEIAAAEATLRSDGAEDPQAELALTEEKLRAASERHGQVQRRARAVEMLHECFQEEQRALAEQFTQPLADTISGYLQSLFGPSARAMVQLSENGFTGLRMSRGDRTAESYGFEALSGGAREQTAAAVRLAMAEVLSADHDGCLPVIFDDAFVYSDPQRVQQLQRMLDLAVSRGLQVIVLTCNPSDYAALGARQVMLGRPSGPGEASAALAKNGSNGTASQRADFVERLRELGGRAGNASLREALGFDEAAYESVKHQLAEAGEILLTNEKGGSVSLAT